jgi:hypothetical protein
MSKQFDRRCKGNQTARHFKTKTQELYVGKINGPHPGAYKHYPEQGYHYRQRSPGLRRDQGSGSEQAHRQHEYSLR